LRASGGALSQKGIELNFHRRQVAKGHSQVNTDSLKLQQRLSTANRDSSSIVGSQNEALSATIQRQKKQLAPLYHLQEAKKTHSIITKKFKARDLESNKLIVSQSPATMTPEIFGKKPLNHLKHGSSTPSNAKDGFGRRQNTNSTENLFNLIN
jgi:predicted RND superfamily exporter protein